MYKIFVQAGFSDDGTINGIVVNMYSDPGCYNNTGVPFFSMHYLDNGKYMYFVNAHTVSGNMNALLQYMMISCVNTCTCTMIVNDSISYNRCNKYLAATKTK